MRKKLEWRKNTPSFVYVNEMKKVEGETTEPVSYQKNMSMWAAAPHHIHDKMCELCENW